jgi:hypothetical protein
VTDFPDRQTVAAKLAETVVALPEALVVTDSAEILAALVAHGLPHRLELVDVGRSDDGVTVGEVPAAADVIVVLIGVETGRTAAGLATTLRAAGAARLTLVTGVLPRQTENLLVAHYDQFFALLRPLAPRSLHWHVG